MSAAKRLKSKMGKGEGNIEAWVQSKITKAADYLDSAAFRAVWFQNLRQ